MSRLDSIAPGLDESLMRRPVESRREAVGAILAAGVRASGVTDERVAQGLDAFLGRLDADPRVVATAAQELDEAAWTAQESGDEPGYASLFRQARAAAAVAYGLSGDLSDAAYEAAHALDNLEDIVPLLG